MIAWLLGTRIGRWISMALAGAAVVLAAFVAGRREGKTASKAKQVKDALKNSHTAREKQDEINKASPDDVVRRLDGWMRHDD